jgi:hypothetical protein
MDDVLLWRTAVDLLRAHGEGAGAEALRLADAAIDGGDLDEFNRWKRVARLIMDMQPRAPDGDMH